MIIIMIKENYKLSTRDEKLESTKSRRIRDHALIHHAREIKGDE